MCLFALGEDNNIYCKFCYHRKFAPVGYRQYTLSPPSLGQIKAGQIKVGQIKVGQIKVGQIKVGKSKLEKSKMDKSRQI